LRELLDRQRQRTPVDPTVWQPADDPRLHILPPVPAQTPSPADCGGLPVEGFEEVVYLHSFVQRFLFRKREAAGPKRFWESRHSRTPNRSSFGAASSTACPFSAGSAAALFLMLSTLSVKGVYP